MRVPHNFFLTILLLFFYLTPPTLSAQLVDSGQITWDGILGTGCIYKDSPLTKLQPNVGEISLVFELNQESKVDHIAYENAPRHIREYLSQWLKSFIFVSPKGINTSCLRRIKLRKNQDSKHLEFSHEFININTHNQTKWATIHYCFGPNNSNHNSHVPRGLNLFDIAVKLVRHDIKHESWLRSNTPYFTLQIKVNGKDLPIKYIKQLSKIGVNCQPCGKPTSGHSVLLEIAQPTQINSIDYEILYTFDCGGLCGSRNKAVIRHTSQGWVIVSSEMEWMA